MIYRHLGRSGLRVSALSFGSWVTFGDQIGEDVALDCMKAAFDAGVNFFDNAEAYSMGKAETIMGNVIERAGWTRSDLVISTKIFWGGEGPNDRGLSRKHIMEGMFASLDRLQMDYVDLVFCHRPDLHTPIEETVRAMSDVVSSGMAFYWGTSEWSAEQIRHAHLYATANGLVPPTMEQPQYHLVHRERVEAEYRPLTATWASAPPCGRPWAAASSPASTTTAFPRTVGWATKNMPGCSASSRVSKASGNCGWRGDSPRSPANWVAPRPSWRWPGA